MNPVFFRSRLRGTDWNVFSADDHKRVFLLCPADVLLFSVIFIISYEVGGKSIKLFLLRNILTCLTCQSKFPSTPELALMNTNISLSILISELTLMIIKIHIAIFLVSTYKYI